MCLPCNIYPILDKQKELSDESKENVVCGSGSSCISGSEVGVMGGGICMPPNLERKSPTLYQVKGN